VSVVRALEQLGIAGVGLAWPNDIVTPHGKLGGILTELRGEYHGPCEAIIGVGLNLRLPPAAREHIRQPVTDIATCTNDDVPDRNLLAAALIEQLAGDLAQLAEAGLAGFVDAYRRRDQLAGQRVRIHVPDAPVTGICRGVDTGGALLVETATGVQKIISSRFPIRREDSVA
jgi:BirA family biotin operon repressor/biotin-[acetyl-CoA-carboxylase] ligase